MDVRDQWNVTIDEARDVRIVLNQPPWPPSHNWDESYFVILTYTFSGQARVGPTRTTMNGGATWRRQV